MLLVAIIAAIAITSAVKKTKYTNPQSGSAVAPKTAFVVLQMPAEKQD